MNKRKISFLIVFISSFFIFASFLNYPKTKKYFWQETENEALSGYINYDKVITELRKEYNNNDIVGFLEFISSKDIITVVQASDNDYYLKHNVSKKEDKTGAIFLDYRVDINKSKKLLVYGHSSRTKDVIFNILEKYYNKDYYEANKYFELTTGEVKKRYEIFAVYVETKDFSYMQTDFENEDDYFEHINNLKKKSLYDTGLSLLKTDEIIILQTCSTLKKYENYKNKYLLIIARRI